MPFAQQLLLRVPSLLLGVIIVGGTIILSVVGLLIVRRLIPHHRLKLHNDVAGPIFGTLGVVYAVLLAFVVIIVWQNFDKASLNVEKEANVLADLYKDAECFPENFKQAARNLVNEYAKTVVNEEWPMLARGQENLHAADLVKKMWLLYSGYVSKTTTEQAFFEESVRKLNELSDSRMIRLVDSMTGINPLLWFVLIVGGINTIIFTFVFGAENLNAQLSMMVLLGVLISLILVTILLMDFPFSGGIIITPKAFQQILLSMY